MNHRRCRPTTRKRWHYGANSFSYCTTGRAPCQLVRAPGFDPDLRGPQPRVLPLHYARIYLVRVPGFDPSQEHPSGAKSVISRSRVQHPLVYGVRGGARTRISSSRYGSPFRRRDRLRGRMSSETVDMSGAHSTVDRPTLHHIFGQAENLTVSTRVS